MSEKTKTSKKTKLIKTKTLTEKEMSAQHDAELARIDAKIAEDNKAKEAGESA